MTTEIMWESKRRGTCETLKEVPTDGKPARILFEGRWYHVIGGMCTKCNKPIVAPYVAMTLLHPDCQPCTMKDQPDRYYGKVEAYYHEDCDKALLRGLK